VTQNDGGDDDDNNNNNFYRAVEWRVHREYNCIMVTRYYNHELRAQYPTVFTAQLLVKALHRSSSA